MSDLEKWDCRFYGSGTTVIVNSAGHYRGPHFYVYGPRNEDEDQWMRDRYKVCHELCDYLNGGDKPAWFDQLERLSEDYCEDLDGTNIRATGPSIDVDPPNLNWREDDSDEAKDARARLMDRLFGVNV